MNVKNLSEKVGTVRKYESPEIENLSLEFENEVLTSSKGTDYDVDPSKPWS